MKGFLCKVLIFLLFAGCNSSKEFGLDDYAKWIFICETYNDSLFNMNGPDVDWCEIEECDIVILDTKVLEDSTNWYFAYKNKENSLYYSSPNSGCIGVTFFNGEPIGLISSTKYMEFYDAMNFYDSLLREQIQKENIWLPDELIEFQQEYEVLPLRRKN